MTNPPVLLLAFANYYEKDSGYLRNLPEERKQIVAAMGRAEAEGLCKLAVLYEATAEEVIGAFRTYKDRVALFHFAGHANAYSLFLEDPFRKRDTVFMAGFAEFLGAQRGLHAVFLNGCSTAEQSRMLIRQGVPAVVSTHSDVSDTVALLLARHFYESLGAGRSIGDAFQEAAALVKSQEGFQDYRALYRHGATAKGLPWSIDYYDEHKAVAASWNLPEVAKQPLYALPPLPELPLPGSPFPGLPPYTAAERPMFWGRDYDIRRLYQAATADSAPELLVIYGASGVGKTSFLQAGLLPFLELDHTVVLWDWAVDGKAPALPEAIVERPAFLALDAPPLASTVAILAKLVALWETRSDVKVILTLPADEISYWEEAFKQQALEYKTFYLPALSLQEIQRVVSGGFKNRLTEEYGAAIGPELAERLAHLLSKDGSSPIAPLLQYSMEQLWAEAGKKSRQQPPLNWAAYQQLMYDGLWMRFIEKQLEALEPAHNESGLFLNLLGECLPEDGNPKLVAASSIAEKYRLGEPSMKALLQQLLTVRLLCTPASGAIVHKGTLRLSHQLLERPLLHLLNRSSRPGQDIPRLLRHHLKHGSHLGEPELIQVQSSLDAIPQFISEELQLIEESTAQIWEEKRRRRRRQIWSSVGVVAILLLGYLFVNPYFLLYGLLLYLAYQGASTLNKH